VIGRDFLPLSAIRRLPCFKADALRDT
jgi:hypothetical protein